MNSKGRSPSVYITEFYMGSSNVQMSTMESGSMTSLMLAGVVIILIVAVVVFSQIFFKRRKKRQTNDHRKQRYSKECKNTLLDPGSLDVSQLGERRWWNRKILIIIFNETFFALQIFKLKSWRLRGKRNIKMSKIEMTDDEQDPDLISVSLADDYLCLICQRKMIYNRRHIKFTVSEDQQQCSRGVDPHAVEHGVPPQQKIIHLSWGRARNIRHWGQLPGDSRSPSNHPRSRKLCLIVII